MTPINDILEQQKMEIEAIMNATNNGYPIGGREIKILLQKIIDLKFSKTKVTVDGLKSFLIQESQLQKITFQTPRPESLYSWGTVDKYQFLCALRPKGYYSHLVAMRMHNLIDYEPKDIYFNSEQIARSTNGILEQSRIDNAFKKKQRITTARTYYGENVYWLLSGKQTKNYGVVQMKTSSGVDVWATDLERTLVDIAVRPAYAGGVNSVLQAYKVAQPNISISKLIKTLRSLNYVYPYHQSIGFYIDTAGNYDDAAKKEFLGFAPLEYDFYLDYEIQNPAYSTKWKIYYPSGL